MKIIKQTLQKKLKNIFKKKIFKLSYKKKDKSKKSKINRQQKIRKTKKIYLFFNLKRSNKFKSQKN